MLNLKNSAIHSCIKKWMDIYYDISGGSFRVLNQGTREYLTEHFEYWKDDFAIELSEVLEKHQPNLFPEFCSEGTIISITEEYIKVLLQTFKNQSLVDFRVWLNRDDD